MDVDFIVAIFVFLLFVGWGFSFYFALFNESGLNFKVTAEAERNRIMNFITVDVYEAPVEYLSPSDVTGGVLRAGNIWYYGERNSTRIFSGEQTLPCVISGDYLYWQADIASGSNNFTIQTAALNSTPNCTGSFPVSSFNITIPWVFEKRGMISQAMISEMAGMDYESFRESIGMNEDFRISVEKASGDITYGKSVPAGPVDVVSKTSERRIFETSEKANITIAVW